MFDELQIQIKFTPVTPDTMPAAMEDVLVVWAPDDGDPPIVTLAYIDRANVWRCSMEGEQVQSPEYFIYWAHQPALPADLGVQASSNLMKRMESHVH